MASHGTHGFAVSDWDYTLEPSDQSAGGFAVRTGLRT
jgi:hypothetical protein